VAIAEWAGIAAPYERSFGALCACTIADLLPELGEPGRLLDVGTGTGSVAIAAARAGWAVDAFDAEQSMIDFAARRPDAAGIRFITAKLPDLPYPDAAFDAIAANFAINHVDHPRASLAELRRVLRPGGRFAATVWPWGKTPSATATLWREIQDETGAYPPPGNRLPAGSDFDRSEAGLTVLFEACGFTDVRARRVEFEWRIDADDLWSGVEAGIALIGYAYRAADAPTRRRMREAYDARTPAFTGEDGLLHFPQAAVLASGIRPQRAIS
jgi:SAM-dependent methyltransferase